LHFPTARVRMTCIEIRTGSKEVVMEQKKLAPTVFLRERAHATCREGGWKARARARSRLTSEGINTPWSPY
jgi:hypothetical protein